MPKRAPAPGWVPSGKQVQWRELDSPRRVAECTLDQMESHRLYHACLAAARKLGWAPSLLNVARERKSSPTESLTRP